MITPGNITQAQKRVLWHLAEGWELRQIHKVDGSIHWTVCLMDGVLAKESFRILPATAWRLGIDLDLVKTDGQVHNDCYRKFFLTSKGAEIAATIQRMDFE